MATDQQLGIYVHGAQVTQSPVHGGLIPVHGGLSPPHGVNGSGIGPELVTNSDLNSATGWNLVSGAAIAGGVLNLGLTQFAEATQFSVGAVAPANGEKYRLVVVVLTLGNAAPVVRMGDNGVLNSMLIAQNLALGTNSYDITIAGSHTDFAVDIFNTLAGTVACVIDSVSVKKLG